MVDQFGHPIHPGDIVLDFDSKGRLVRYEAPAHRHAEAPVSEPSTFWRPLRPAEQFADMAARRAAIEEPTAALSATLTDLARRYVQDVASRVGRRWPLSPSDVRHLAGNARLAAQFRMALGNAMQTHYDAARTDVLERVAQRGKTQLAEHHFAAGRVGLVGTQARQFFKQKSFTATGKFTTDVLAKAKSVLFNALRQDKTPDQVQFEVQKAMQDMIPIRDSAGRRVNVPARIETIARTNLMEAINEGRWAAFTDPEIVDLIDGVQYSAVLDDSTRDNHLAWDGVTRPIDDPIWFGPPDERPPNGFNCRCELVSILVGDDTPMTPDDELPDVEACDEGFK